MMHIGEADAQSSQNYNNAINQQIEGYPANYNVSDNLPNENIEAEMRKLHVKYQIAVVCSLCATILIYGLVGNFCFSLPRYNFAKYADKKIDDYLPYLTNGERAPCQFINGTVDMYQNRSEIKFTIVSREISIGTYYCRSCDFCSCDMIPNQLYNCIQYKTITLISQDYLKLQTAYGRLIDKKDYYSNAELTYYIAAGLLGIPLCAIILSKVYIGLFINRGRIG